MNYKQYSDDTIDNSVGIYDDKRIDEEFFSNSNQEFAVDVMENLANTILNFEKSLAPIDDLKTIQRCLNFNMQFDIDSFLTNCNAVQVMIFHLSDENYSTVNDILITLCGFVIKCKSEFTLMELCKQINIFSELLDNRNIFLLLPNFTQLLQQVIKYDDGEFTYQLLTEFSFIEKIANILNPPYDDPRIFTAFICCITCVINNFSKNEFHQRDDKFAIQEQNYQKKNLLRLPFSIVHEYIISQDQFTLFPILKLYRIILINRSGDIENYLPEDIFEKIVYLLEYSKCIDPAGFLLKRVLKIIDVFIFLYLGNTRIDYSIRVKKIIDIFISLLSDPSKLPFQPVKEEMKSSESYQWLPYIINLLGRISKYDIAAKILSEKNCLENLFKIYENLKYEMKCSLSIVFLNVFIKFSDEIVDNIIDNGSNKYDFIDIVIHECIDSLPNFKEGEVSEKVLLIFKAFYHLFSADLEIKMLFDEETMLELLDEYGDDPTCYQYCLRIREFLERPIEVCDISDIVF